MTEVPTPTESQLARFEWAKFKVLPVIPIWLEDEGKWLIVYFGINSIHIIAICDPADLHQHLLRHHDESLLRDQLRSEEICAKLAALEDRAGSIPISDLEGITIEDLGIEL